MYGLTNTVNNRSNIAIFCAYSAPSAQGGPDIWKVSQLLGSKISTKTDIDYVRAVLPGEALGWTGGFGKGETPVWRQSGWIKIRQLVATTIRNARNIEKLGLLSVDVLAEPTPALVEAKTYDTGWHLLGSKATRGTDAVKQAMAEWEDIIRNGLLSRLPDEYS
jgi:hypothetical protein